LIRNVKSAEANLKAANARAVEIGFENAVVEDLPSPFTEAGTEVTVNPQCVARLKAMKDQGQLINVVVNERALLVNKFSIKIDQSGSASASVDVDVKALITVKPELKTESKGKSALDVSSPMYVGFNARKITDVVPTFKVGPEAWVVKSSPYKLPGNYLSQK